MNQRVIIVRCEDIQSLLIGALLPDIPTEDEIKAMGITDVMIESCGEGSIFEILSLFKLDRRLALFDKYLNEMRILCGWYGTNMEVKDIPEQIPSFESVNDMIRLKTIKSLVAVLTPDRFQVRLNRMIDARIEFLLKQDT